MEQSLDIRPASLLELEMISKILQLVSQKLCAKFDQAPSNSLLLRASELVAFKVWRNDSLSFLFLHCLTDFVFGHQILKKKQSLSYNEGFSPFNATQLGCLPQPTSEHPEGSIQRAHGRQDPNRLSSTIVFLHSLSPPYLE